MFSDIEKQDIAAKVQKLLRSTGHGELPKQGEVNFILHVDGEEEWSWANIVNNSRCIAMLPERVKIPDDLLKNMSVDTEQIGGGV